MAHVDANGIRLEYEVDGAAANPAMLLIHGVGAQLVQWPEQLRNALVEQGFRVISFDNRDVGLSSSFNHESLLDGELPYTVADMAQDAASLLTALGIDKAHVFGVSLGGVIAQLLATDHPQKVRSLTLMMTHTANAALPAADPETLVALSSLPPDPNEDEEGYIKSFLDLLRVIGSPKFPTDEAESRALAIRMARRAYNPKGAARQFRALQACPDLRTSIQGIRVPTMVIHGSDDRLIPIAGGEDIVRHIPGACMLTVKGMGHDLPLQLADLFASVAGANARLTPAGS